MLTDLRTFLSLETAIFDPSDLRVGIVGVEFACCGGVLRVGTGNVDPLEGSRSFEGV